MKRALGLFTALTILIFTFAPPARASDAAVYVEGVRSACRAVLKDGVSYIPLRDFCRERGINVGWDKKTRSAVVMGENTVAVFKDKSSVLFIFEQGINVKYPCFIEKGAFYVLARSLGVIFDKSVAWDGSRRAVCFGGAAGANGAGTGETRDDLYWLSRIISAESAGEPMEGKIAVGNVVLNRVKSPDFPDTVYGVIFDDNYGTQFTPAALGTVYVEPTAESVDAARRCLAGENVAETCLYFFNPKISTAQKWIVENRVFCKSIGDHDFYY
ncbi:MAG: cell wall hydrolase [Clostridia bacterium]|nr:cell wall hydrolase [Clostridia bacterium]